MASDALAAAQTTDQALLDIWLDVLDVDELDSEADFFELGGRSLHAMQIVARIQETLGVELPADALFDTPTLAGLAAAVESARGERGETAFPLPARNGPVMSPDQEEMWCTQAYTPGLRPHTPEVYRLLGPLDTDALERAFAEVVRRHESLRTVFREQRGRPQPTVLVPEPVSIPITDVSAAHREDREEEASGCVWQAVATPFDLAARPPWRVELVRLAPESHLLVVVLHEIICDGWSLGLLFGELSTLYGGFLAGETSGLEELPVQYSDAAVQLERNREAAAAYWKDALQDAPLTLALPWETAGQPCEHGARQQRSLQLGSRRALAALEELSREEAATEFMLHLAAFYALLHRYTGEGDLVVTSPGTLRAYRELEGLIGLFARNMPLRVRLGDDPSFRELLRRVRQAVLDGSANAAGAPLFLTRLLEADGPRGLRGLSFGFRTSTATDNPLGHSFELAGLRVEPYDYGKRPGSHLWLSVSGQPGRATTVTLIYDEGVPDGATIDRMLRSYAAILDGAAQDPDMPLSELKILSPEDRRKLLSQWKQKSPPVAAGGSLHAMVASQARRTPDAVAVSASSGDVSYGQLVAGADRFARDLLERGVEVGSTVPVGFEPSAGTLEAMLGILKAGCVCRAPAAGEPAPGAGGDEGEELAFVVPTAGVTGPPKPVSLSHEALLRAANWFKREHRLTAADRALHLPGAGALAWALTPFAYLAAGATVVVPEGDEMESVAELAGSIGRRGLTVLSAPPGVASELLDRHAREIEPLRMLMVPGPGHLELGTSARDGAPKVVRQYAIAEAGGVAMSIPATALPAASTPLPIATPASSNGPAFVLDRKRALVPLGVTGELYLGAGEPSSSTPGDRLLRTGDLARRRADGTLEFLGRKDDEVNFRGFRLAPRLIDLDGALRAHEAVEDAAAHWDSEAEELVAFLVLGPSPVPSHDELDGWLQEKMPRWILPSRYRVVAALPLRADGTPDRGALPEIPSRPLDGDTERKEPHSRSERKLAAIWRELLGRSDVGVRDNFFVLGGTPALGMEMVARANAAGIPLTAHALISSPTIADLVRGIGSDRRPRLAFLQRRRSR